MTLSTRLIEPLESLASDESWHPLYRQGVQAAISIIRAELSKPLPEGELIEMASAIQYKLQFMLPYINESALWDKSAALAKAAYAAIVGASELNN